MYYVSNFYFLKIGEDLIVAFKQILSGQYYIRTRLVWVDCHFGKTSRKVGLIYHLFFGWNPLGPLFVKLNMDGSVGDNLG